MSPDSARSDVGFASFFALCKIQLVLPFIGWQVWHPLLTIPSYASYVIPLLGYKHTCPHTLMTNSPNGKMNMLLGNFQP